MNLHGRKISAVTITLTISLLVMSVAFAAVLSTHTITNTITIAQGDFGVFADPECTQPLTSLTWNQMGNNQWQMQTIYLLNNGDGNPVYVWWEAPDLNMALNAQVTYPITSPFPSPSPTDSSSPLQSPSPSGGFWYFSSMNKVELYPGQPVQVQVWLTSSGASGSYSWNIVFTGEDSP